MKKYIRICNCCGNTFETDFKFAHHCKACSPFIGIDMKIVEEMGLKEFIEEWKNFTGVIQKQKD
jgi:hypothetical protein